MSIAKRVEVSMKESSWIRRMFEEGEEMRRKIGPENVFDFTLGNPIMEPPAEFQSRLLEVLEQGECHGYTGPLGWEEVRAAVAEHYNARTGLEFTQDHIIMTCGAAGGFNCVLKAIIDPGDEIVIFVPYFAEYLFYISNAEGVAIKVETDEEFGIDVAALEEALSPKTKAVVINSPNNPTGRVYDEAMLAKMARLLEAKQKEYGHEIYLLSDEPYRAITYNGCRVPEVANIYRNSLVMTSHSKDLGLAGERIGTIALRPGIDEYEELREAIAFTTRALGFKSAPATIQRVVSTLQDCTVDIAAYERKRKMLCEGLARLGFEFHKPEGAFYLFPRTPIPDDVAFIKELQKEGILTVPGSGFGRPGYIRISYCVEDDTITRAMPSFEKVARRMKMI